MNSPSNGLPQGVRVQVRLLVSHSPEQRFDSSGREVLQIRGTVVDNTRRHPPVVARFAGQRQAELFRWAEVGKHLSVDGSLEVKYWTESGRPKIAYLIDALNIYPLNDLEPNLSRIGIYATPTTAPAETVTRTSLGKAARAETLRRMLDET